MGYGKGISNPCSGMGAALVAFVLPVEVVSAEGLVATGLDFAALGALQHYGAFAGTCLSGTTASGLLHCSAPIVTVGSRKRNHFTVAIGTFRWAAGWVKSPFLRGVVTKFGVPASSSFKVEFFSGASQGGWL